MATNLIIPTIFTATNRLSPEVQKMRNDVIGFANSAERGFNKFDKTVRGLVPGLGKVQKQFVSMASAGAALAGAFQLGSFSFNTLANYEAAVDAFRVIVDDLSDAEFTPFEKKIMQVASITKRSGTEVAVAFEKIAGINEKFAQTADGLGEVTQAAITLGKAARMDIGVASENLIGIMNQFSFSTDKANRTINALAAGQAIGAANISQTAEAFTIFGSVAAGSNITLEESVGLIQTLGRYSLYGAEAGTKLRGSIMRLQRAGLGYASGQFNINDALKQTNEFLGKLKTAKEKDLIINKLFGVENVTAGRILLNNIGIYEEFTKRVTGTNEAYKEAEINSGNLRTQLQQLGAAWENMLINSEGAGSGMKFIGNSVQWLTNNLDGLVSTVVTAGKIVLGYTAITWGIRKAFLAWNVTLGISSVLTRAYSSTLVGNEAALAARNATLKLANLFTAANTAATTEATAATIGFNGALAANPIFVTTALIAGLAAGIGYLVYHQRESNEEFQEYLRMKHDAAINSERMALDELTASYERNNKEKGKALSLALQERVLQSRNRIAELEQRQNRAQAAMDKAGGTLFGELGSDYKSAAREKQYATSDLLYARESSRAIQEEAIRAANLGLITGENLYNIVSGNPLNFGTPAAKREQSRSSIASSPEIDEIVKKVSQDIKITIENNSNNPVKVSNGNDRGLSVQPSQVSTKNLTPAYGR